jgi:chorismate mutase/prephenate dehydratase
MKTLLNLRNKIDKIDTEIVRLLDERMQVCHQVGEFKKCNNVPLTHTNREEQIVDRLSASSDLKSLTKNEIISFYEIIFKISKSKQK